MKLIGDAEGIAALKRIHQKNPDFLKFLLKEAQTNTDHAAQFKDDETQRRWMVAFSPQSGEISVSPV